MMFSVGMGQDWLVVRTEMDLIDDPSRLKMGVEVRRTKEIVKVRSSSLCGSRSTGDDSFNDVFRSPRPPVRLPKILCRQLVNLFPCRPTIYIYPFF